MWYRQTTNATLHQKALADIQRAYPAVSSIDYLFIATWDHVHHYRSRSDKVVYKTAVDHCYHFW